MGRKTEHHRLTQQRRLVAQTAARLMAENGLRDFALAKHKAAEQLGLHHSHELPGNEEVEEALREYQRLFQQPSQQQQLQLMRRTALQAMTLFELFSPRLVGPVLNGTADQYCPIELHLFADTSEEVGIFLMQHNIPFELAEAPIRYTRQREQQKPLYHFVAGEYVVELTVFTINELRQPPLSKVDGRAQQRADRHDVTQLLEAEVASH